MSKQKLKDITIVKNEASDLEKRYSQLETILGEGWKGIILDVKSTTSHTFYGVNTYDDREGYEIAVKLQSDKGETFKQFFSFPDVRGVVKSNLYLFNKKYNSVPKKGLEVDVIINDSGFFEIVI